MTREASTDNTTHSLFSPKNHKNLKIEIRNIKIKLKIENFTVPKVGRWGGGGFFGGRGALLIKNLFIMA